MEPQSTGTKGPGAAVVSTRMITLRALKRAAVVVVLAVVPVACAPIYSATCKSSLVTSSAGPVTDPALVEISGIHAGVRNPTMWWVHNDSGDTARAFALDATGAVRGTFAFSGASALDWEDIAVVPGPTPGSGTMYVGDIGDNALVRTEIQVYRAAEPDVPATGTPASTTLTGVETLRLTYPDGPHDAEALMVDPIFGDLVIIAKSLSGGTVNVYRAPANLAAGSTTAMTNVGSLGLATGLVNSVTAADVTRDGTAIAVRTYGKVMVFNRNITKSLWTAFSSTACNAPLPAEVQGEAVGFRDDGKALATISEGANQMLHLSTIP